MVDNVLTDDLEALACEVSAYLRDKCACWKDRYGVPYGPGVGTATKDMCRAVATATAIILTKETGIQWEVAGGLPSVPENEGGHYTSIMPGGYKTDRAWNGHFWAVAVGSEPPLLVDLSADQFGEPDVVVAQGYHPNYRENLRRTDPKGEDTARVGYHEMLFGEGWALDFELDRSPMPSYR